MKPCIVVELSEGNGLSIVTHEGRKICAGTNPIALAARELIARGYSPRLQLVVRDGDGDHEVGALRGLAQ